MPPDVEESSSLSDSRLAGPLKILREATSKVPATRYALAVAGIASASAIVRLFAGGDMNKAVLVLAIMIVFMVAMLVFARLTRLGDGLFRAPAVAILWSSVLLFIVASALSLTSVFFGAPLDWRPMSAKPAPRAAQGPTSPSATVVVPNSQNERMGSAPSGPEDRQRIQTGTVTASSAARIDVGVVESTGSSAVQQDINTKDLKATGSSTIRVGVVKKD